jgi:hypothetical protein
MTGDIKGAQLTPRGRNGFGGDPEIHTRPCVDTRRRCHGWRATDRLVQGMPALEGTGFEPSVPLGRIGASNSAWIAFGRRLGLRIEHAISIDGEGSLQREDFLEVLHEADCVLDCHQGVLVHFR